MRISRKWLAGGAALALVPGAAFAQDRPDEADGSDGIAEIVVTAQKRSESSQTVPISISALDSEIIARTGIVTLDAVQRLTPGMTISTIGSGFASYTYIRGAGTNVFDIGADPSVAYFVDEIYQAGTAGLQPDLLDVERIEVLKGPQGTLFGRNAAAGAVSIIIKRPENEFNAWARGGIGTYQQFEASGGVTGPISSDGAWRYRLAASHRERDGYVRNLGTGRDPGFMDNYSGRGSIEYAGGTVTALISADVVRMRNGMTPQYITTANKTSLISVAALAANPAGEDMYHRYYNVDGHENQNGWTMTGRLEWDMGGATLTSVTGYRKNRFWRLQDHDGSIADAWTFINEEKNRTFSEELRLSGESDRLQWVLGGFFYSNRAVRRDQAKIGKDFAVPVFAAFPGDYLHHLNTTSYAAFGQVKFNLTDQLSITGGARYTHDRKVSHQNSDPAGPVARFTVDVPRSWNSFDPAVTVQYQANPDFMVYGSYKRGFKSGGFQSLPATAALAATPFNPEHVSAFELGFKSQMLDRHVQFNAAAFWNDISNQQILRLLSPTITFVDNAGHTRAKGVDVTLSVLPFRNFRIDGGMTYQHARFTKYLSGAADYSGNHQLRSPDFTASVGAEYKVPLPNGEIVLRGDWFHQSAVWFDGANLTLPGGFQPAYDLINAQVAFRPGEGNLDIALWAKNLGKERYYRNIAIQGTAGIGVPGEPLTAGISLSWKLR